MNNRRLIGLLMVMSCPSGWGSFAAEVASEPGVGALSVNCAIVTNNPGNSSQGAQTMIYQRDCEAGSNGQRVSQGSAQIFPIHLIQVGRDYSIEAPQLNGGTLRYKVRFQ